jgi:hypothetical protein
MSSPTGIKIVDRSKQRKWIRSNVQAPPWLEFHSLFAQLRMKLPTSTRLPTWIYNNESEVESRWSGEINNAFDGGRAFEGMLSFAKSLVSSRMFAVESCFGYRLDHSEAPPTWAGRNQLHHVRVNNGSKVRSLLLSRDWGFLFLWTTYHGRRETNT